MSGLRFGELFAGAGGLSLGLERAGLECAWHAEWNEDARCVLKHRWPDVPLYGDVSTLDGYALTRDHGPIDLLSGGSPCQDLSVAGKRKGLEGNRSSLFFQQMRLWNETGADLCLWENVDGARSSNDGKDFGAVLRAFVGAAIAVPSDGWRSAGVAAGPRGVAAWRILDAQFFGVPQRRRRVFVLGTRTGRVDPAEILSLAEGLLRDSQASREAWEGFAPDAGSGVAVPLLEVGKRTGASTTDIRAGSGIGAERDPMYTLQAGAQHGVVAFDTTQVTSKANRSKPRAGDPCHPLAAGAHAPLAVAFDWQNSPSQGMEVRSESDDSLRVKSVPAVLAFNQKQDGSDADEIAPTLLSMPHDKSHANGGGQLAVCLTGEVTHALTHEGHDASEDGTGRGVPLVVGPLEARTSAGGFPGTDGAISGHIVANTITAREAKGWNPARDVGNGTVAHGIPRRLTPRECERLMGWPDDHSLVHNTRGKPMSDAARYKMCGNGVASVVTHWIGWRLMLALSVCSCRCLGAATAERDET